MGTPEPTLAEREAMTTSYQSFLHNTSLTMLFLAPALIALPPRKLDFYTFTLAGAFCASANHLTKESTGRGILSNMTPSWARRPATGAEGMNQKTKAEDFASKYRAEKDRKRLLEEPTPASTSRAPTYSLEEKAKELWMGGEQEGWKGRRLREEQEKIEQGEGYGSMIMDQIWEVWNWGEKKNEEVLSKDKEVVDQRERDRRMEEEFPTIGKDGR